MTTLNDQLNRLHFDDSTFKLATKNQNGICCLCCAKGTQTFAPTKLVIHTKTLRGNWPDRYLCSICANTVARVDLRVKQVLVGNKTLAEQLFDANISEEEEAIIRQLSNRDSLTAGQLKVAIGGPLRKLQTTEVRDICQSLCDRDILQRNFSDHYSRYSLAEELAHAS